MFTWPAPLLVTFVAVATTSMVADGIVPALPILQRELHASIDSMGWFYTAPMLSAVVATPIVAKFADAFDKRRVLFVILALLCAGMLLSAIASAVPMLIFGQLLGGLSLSLLPLSVGLIAENCNPGQARTANGIVGALGALSPSIGLLLCGPVIEHLSFRWLFAGPLVLLVICLVICAWILWCKAQAALGSDTVTSMPISAMDWQGALLLSISLGTGLLAVSRLSESSFTDPSQVGLFAAAFVFTVQWVRWERRVADPLVKLSLLRAPLNIGCSGCMFGAGFAIIGASLCVPWLVELPVANGGLGGSAGETGSYFVVLALAGTVTTLTVNTAAKVIGSRALLVLAMLSLAATIAALAFGPTTVWRMNGCMAALGATFTVVLVECMNVVMGRSLPHETTQASALAWVAKSIGATLGGQAAAGVLAAGSSAGGTPALTAIHAALLVCAAIAAGSGVLALLVPRQRAQRLADRGAVA